MPSTSSDAALSGTNRAEKVTGMCEFTPCRTCSTIEPRKVISHIFGRNKSLTKRLPPAAWVHYCRQHYQRARYRSRDWPITQCQLVLVSLSRMQAWPDSGIQGFRVVLRRRAICSHSEVVSGEGRSSNDATVSTDRESTLDISTRSKAGERLAFPSCSVTATITVQADHRCRSPGVKNGGRVEKRKQRRKPTITSCPVPGWLLAEADDIRIRSFDEVRDIIGKLKNGFETMRDCRTGLNTVDDFSVVDDRRMNTTMRFPDIEILPVFLD